MKGDILASGGKSATFGPPKVSQRKWNKIFGKGVMADTNFEEIKNHLDKDDGQLPEGVVPTDKERFGRLIPTDTENERHQKNPFKTEEGIGE